MTSERDDETYAWMRANYSAIYGKAVCRFKEKVFRAKAAHKEFKENDPYFKVLVAIEQENKAYQEHPLPAYEQELKMTVATLQAKMQYAVKIPTFTTPPQKPMRTLLSLTEEYRTRVSVLQIEVMEKLAAAQEQTQNMLSDFIAMTQPKYDMYIDRTHEHVDRILALEAQRDAFSEEAIRQATATEKHYRDIMLHLEDVEEAMIWCCNKNVLYSAVEEEAIQFLDDTFKAKRPEWFERYKELYAKINTDPIYAEKYNSRCYKCGACLPFGRYLAPGDFTFAHTQCQIAKSSTNK